MFGAGGDLQISPNPFNPTTAISYELRAASFVTLKIYNIYGKLVTTLVNGLREAGMHQVTFDGSGLPSGLYFYRLTAQSTEESHATYTEAKRMVLIK